MASMSAAHATIGMDSAMGTQFDDLLDGLNADDFDLDEDGAGLDEPVGSIRAFETVYTDCVTDESDNYIGRKKPVPGPSAEALRKAQQQLDDTTVDPAAFGIVVPDATSESQPLSPPSAKRARLNDPSPGFASASGKPAPSISAHARSAVASLPHVTASSQGSPMPARSYRPTQRVGTGFTSASGSAAPRIPAAARAGATRMMNEELAPAPAPAPIMTGGFSTGSGRAVAPPSEAALKRAQAMFDEAGAEPLISAGPSMKAATSSGFTTGSGGAVAAPSAAAMQRAAALLDDTPSTSAPSVPVSSGFITGDGNAVAGPSSAARIQAGSLFGDANTSTSATPARTRPSQSMTGGGPTFTAPFSTPFRTPLRQTSNLPTPRIGMGISPAVKGKPITIGTPASGRRAGMGLGPTKGKAKTGFITPFKRANTAAVPSLAGAAVTPLQLAPAPTPIRSVQEQCSSGAEALFDLTPRSGRKTYRDAFVKPQYYSVAELESMDIPPEIWQIDPSNALYYDFAVDDGTDRGAQDACKALLDAGAAHATLKWVENHWSLILWKLAGIIQGKPDMVDALWTYEEVERQLKYRYEREHNLAQRPIIRRIQEHDSSPALSMVLCVVRIHRPPASSNEKGDLTPVKPFLELTDGWYRIYAQIDSSLERAIKTDKIRPGRKLGITGAKLDSAADGAEVLEAFEKSRLVISGNSTKLVRWDTKLGVQPRPWIAGLSSLNLDGGIITAVDVRLDKVFPVAYIDQDKEKRGTPWNEEEEAERRDRWKEKYEGEVQRLQDKATKELEKLEELVSALFSAAEGIEERVTEDHPGDIETRFEELLSLPSPTSTLSRMPTSLILHLAGYAGQYLERERSNQQAEMMAEIDTICPPRQVRDFQIVRIVDAIRGNRDPTRAGMLNVWEAKALGEGTLQEGKRYLITSLMPGRQGDWRTPSRYASRSDTSGLVEVSLHTRRNTRWQVIEEN